MIVDLPLPGAPKMKSDARETIAPPMQSITCCSSSSSPRAFLSMASVILALVETCERTSVT